MATSINWRQLSLNYDFHEKFATLPSRLQHLNMKGALVPFCNLFAIPITVQRVVGMTVLFEEWSEMDELVLQFFGSMPSINLLGSFSDAISLLFPNVVNCRVQLSFELEARQLLEWVPVGTEKLRLKEASLPKDPAFTSEVLLPNIHRLQALKVIDCDWDYRISDPSIFDTSINLQTMRVKLEPDFIRCLPRSLTHLRVDCVQATSNAVPSDWPPNLTHLELHGNTRSFVQSLAPEVMPHLQTLILASDELTNAQVGNVPRSLTSLQIKGTQYTLSDPSLPPSLTSLKVQGLPSNTLLSLLATLNKMQQ
jgi:hypothetical protein